MLTYEGSEDWEALGEELLEQKFKASGVLERGISRVSLLLTLPQDVSWEGRWGLQLLD